MIGWIETMARLLAAGLARRRGERVQTCADGALTQLDDTLLADLGVTRSGVPLPMEPHRRGVGRQSGGAISKPEKSKPGETVQLTSVQAPRLVAVCQ